MVVALSWEKIHFPFQGTFEISEDIFDGYNEVGYVCYWHTLGRGQDAVEHPMMHCPPFPPTRIILQQHCSSEILL